MEYQFLDSKLPVDLTNLIAYVGPKNNKFVKKINNIYQKSCNNIYDELLRSNMDEYQQYTRMRDIYAITDDEFEEIYDEQFILRFWRDYFNKYKEHRQDRLREIEILKSINWNDNDDIDFIDD